MPGKKDRRDVGARTSRCDHTCSRFDAGTTYRVHIRAARLIEPDHVRDGTPSSTKPAGKLGQTSKQPLRASNRHCSVDEIVLYVNDQQRRTSEMRSSIVTHLFMVEPQRPPSGWLVLLADTSSVSTMSTQSSRSETVCLPSGGCEESATARRAHTLMATSTRKTATNVIVHPGTREWIQPAATGPVAATVYPMV